MTTTQPPLAIEATGLVKSFGETRAVDGVDLAVRSGTVYGVLGPNGAGKTTTIRMLATLLRPDAGAARVLGHDIVRDAETVRGLVSLTGQLASVDEDLTGHENLVLLGLPARPQTARREGARRRAARRVRAQRGGRQARQALLRRDAPAPGHRGEHRRHAAAHVPRRADDGPGPALAQPGLGHHPHARRGGHDDPALHAVPRGGRPARRPHRRDRPRHGHRRGHARRAEGVGRLRRAARAAARSRAAPGGRADPRARAGHGPPRPDPAALSAPCADADRAAEAVAALGRAGMRVGGFSLGQPSLDEVFLALTGHPAEEQTGDEQPHDRGEERAA